MIIYKAFLIIGTKYLHWHKPFKIFLNLIVKKTMYAGSFGLIGIQLPEKYKENFDVSSEGPSLRSQ